MVDKILVVDCKTGEEELRDLTKSEKVRVELVQKSVSPRFDKPSAEERLEHLFSAIESAESFDEFKVAAAKMREGV